MQRYAVYETTFIYEMYMYIYIYKRCRKNRMLLGKDGKGKDSKDAGKAAGKDGKDPGEGAKNITSEKK